MLALSSATALVLAGLSAVRGHITRTPSTSVSSSEALGAVQLEQLCTEPREALQASHRDYVDTRSPC